tara:strand:- start:747 stop:1490 length:744 start_codon:yes stop_codon:yes gene_type:complete
MIKIILLRHGQSQWNLENRFTGWKDVSLTPEGMKEAKFAAEQIKDLNSNISSVYTSLLNRATETTDIVVEKLQFPIENIKYEWRLNERHYGALQGLNKSETATKYGEKQVKIWRRSFDISPPLLDESDERNPAFNLKFRHINKELPLGESLKDVIDRLKPFWKSYTTFLKENHGTHLIIAHSNSLRAIVKILEGMSNQDIISVDIPTGIPLVYSLDDNLKVNYKKYLIDDAELEKRQKIIKNQGKAN